MERAEGNLTVVERMFRDLDKGDTVAWLQHFTDDATWDTSGGGHFAGRYQGKEGLARFAELVRIAHGDQRAVGDIGLYATGDRVFAEFTWSPVKGAVRTAPSRTVAVITIGFGRINGVREFVSFPMAPQG